jgi:hypothetical protein
MNSLLPAFHVIAEASLDKEWSYNMGLWLIGALSVVSTAASVWSIFFGKSKTEIQQPLRVEWEKEFATKSELQRVDERVTQLDESVDERFAAAAKAGSDSREKLYTKLNTISETTAALKREAELQSVRQVQIESKLDRLNERFADHASKTTQG